LFFVFETEKFRFGNDFFKKSFSNQEINFATRNGTRICAGATDGGRIFYTFLFLHFLTQVKPLKNHIYHKNYINQSSDSYSINIKKYYIAF